MTDTETPVVGECRHCHQPCTLLGDGPRCSCCGEAAKPSRQVAGLLSEGDEILRGGEWLELALVEKRRNGQCILRTVGEPTTHKASGGRTFTVPGGRTFLTTVRTPWPARAEADAEAHG